MTQLIRLYKSKDGDNVIIIKNCKKNVICIYIPYMYYHDTVHSAKRVPGYRQRWISERIAFVQELQYG